MLVNNIKIIHNPNFENKFSELDKSFVNLLFDFFKLNNVVEIYVNSTLRKHSKGSFHAVGFAIDLHYVKFKNNKFFYFSRREKDYSISNDLKFFDLFNNYFQNYRIEYFSPSKMYSINTDRYNLYKDSTQVVINQKLNDKNQGKTIDLDTGHLDHLHIAINPNKLAKPRAIIKNIFTSLALPGLFFF